MSNSKRKKKTEDENVRVETEQGDDKTPDQDVNELLKTRVQELEAQVADIKDQMLRKQAELENFRKRLLKDKEEAVKYANVNLLTDLITIIDDFERAIQSATVSRDFDSFHSGIELIEKRFTGMLEKKWGLTRIVSVGKEFDPQKHEAIGMEESPDYETETVIEDYQKGYTLQDRVVRPAKVKVAVPSKKGAEEEKKAEAEEAAEETTGETTGETVADEQ